jgi:type I restriction-modification system DNA methylase subunit/REP element-mobilizing transposase RayT
MSLFQTSVIKKYLNDLSPELIGKKYKDFQAYFGNPEIQENIRNLKEEEFQSEFIRNLFVNILEYILNPEPNYNIVLEKKNADDSKKADGAILRDNEVVAVIELKSTQTTDLDTVETQAFGYKNHNPKCQYIITSNFEKIRLYIQNAIDHLEFDLFNLNKEDFSLLWLCFSKDNILNDIPLKIKESSVLQEENVTKKLYNDYSRFRTEIFDDILKNNPEFDKLVLFKKTQKLLDRFLFILFAEDRNLLPPNSVSRILERWNILQREDAYKPLYDIFKQYFGYLNTGRKGQVPNDDIFSYNGGLFAPDDILDNIKISDELLHKHTLQLSTYDFETEVDVNILGHIFEHSLGEIENIQASMTGGVNPADKTQSKRKKDGIFYTPKYITKYIVENTVGKLCEEKRAELEIVDEEYAKGRKNRKKEIVKDLDNKLTEYREWLLNITILDPACGSGAFLNQALEFLIGEHKKIDELKAQLLGGSIVFSDIEAKILEKNIYGVDLNEESVEIAKLSLWLRTAQKGRKLTTISNHIKCGNSLIDDHEIAGEKAFNWQKQFPEVFKEKEKRSWHVTMVLHNSRYALSDGYTRQMEPGYISPTYPELSDEQQEIIAEELARAAAEYQLNILACNICNDHVHAIIVCEQEELSELVGKWKGRSAFEYNRRVNPSISEQHAMYSDGTKEKFWAKSFHKNEITDNNQLANTIEYIRNNREKHLLPTQSDGLTRRIEKMKCSHQHAFRTEYKGGFDVVIGNPPYVHLEKIKETSIALKNANYKTYHSQGDIYCVFVEKGTDILKENGLISYIMPNKWLQAGYGKPLREFFLKYNMIELIDFGDIQIFDGATTYPCIFVSQKSNPQKEISISVLRESNEIDFKFNVIETAEKFETKSFSGETWVISSGKAQKILERLKNNFQTLSDIIGGQSYRGVLTGLTEAFLIDETTKNEIINAHPEAIDRIKPFLQGRDLNRYGTIFPTSYLLIFEKGFTNENIPSGIEAQEWLEKTYPSISNWLKPFEEKGKKRTDKGDYWWELRACDYYNKFSEPKIMYQKFQVKPCFIYDDQGLYCNDSMWIIPTNNKSLLGILNSKTGWWLISKYCTQIQNGSQLIWKYFGQIPIPPLSESKLDDLVDMMITYNSNLNDLSNKFIKYIQSQFLFERLSNKLQNWYGLDFSEFIKEIYKAINIGNGKKLSKADEMEWMEVFESKKEEIHKIKTEIDKTDKEIDQMVYKLYDLTEEEIKIVEEAI